MRRVDLGWMRVFVEVGRAGSLSEAAARLNITQPAVSYQIRRAEGEFGVALLLRKARGVDLTAEGRALYDILARAVTQVDALAEELRPQPRRKALRLFTDYAFSSLWLMPRLHLFRAAHPELELQIVALQHAGVRAEGEMAVVFANRAELGAEAVQIMPEAVVPVCAPALRAGLPAGVLPDAPLIHLDAEPGAVWFDWPSYLRALTLARDPHAERGDLRFNTYALVIEAALAGQGVALGWRGLVDRLLARDQLVEAGPELSSPERGYFLVATGPRDAAAEALWSWLRAEAGLSSG
ncbi:putative choline sulfate-utilization transcription factor [Rhodobacter viridis]|uniref:Putative choline sulfate-utilization transcription factor n=1 Tax=Rhodobacter viridis TaxID=1054202 RepID=A0A318TS81_9RHOB|nr:LysR family transcriptional regulator [Rhodobacter viridis]PYF07706.1 putative choline sulfate-utilization transcription factor [Rhodobacter viridis]